MSILAVSSLPGWWGRRVVAPLRELLLLGALCAPCIPQRAVHAQDDFFRPTVDSTPTPNREGPGPIFSFARIETDFRELCRGLELDGRRERIATLAREHVGQEKACITCRSFWKMIVSACANLGPRPTPTPKVKRRPGTQIAEKTATSEESKVTPATEGQEGTATSPTAEMQKTPARIRGTKHPSAEVLDQASRLSIAIYQVDGSEGQTAKMFHYFAKSARECPDLSVEEREYYDIVLTYLLAAWSGRVDSTKLPPPSPAPELDGFFE
jgi:hypothetical protein